MPIRKIKIEEIYRMLVRRTRKGNGGYTSGDDFTRDINESQVELFEFFHWVFEEHQQIVDHLQPFIIKDRLLTISDKGMGLFPDNYGHKLSVGHVYIENPEECGEEHAPLPYPVWYLKAHEVDPILNSSTARPSMEKKRFYHAFENDGIQFYPEDLKAFTLTYLRYPKDVKATFNLSNANGEDIQTLDPNSGELEWNWATFPWFEYLMLLRSGADLKEKTLFEFAQSKLSVLYQERVR